jgi:hypothetical protein
MNVFAGDACEVGLFFKPPMRDDDEIRFYIDGIQVGAIFVAIEK